MRTAPEATRRPASGRALFAAALLAGLAWTAGIQAQAGRTAPQATGQAALPTAKLNIGLNLITAEVAKDDQSRQFGLMFRQSLAPNHGMLFVFEHRTTHCMWMRNTLIPLSVAFVDEDGRIVNIEDMQPKDETTRHCSRQPTRYALEMTQSWFAQRKIGPGDVIRGLPKPQ